MKIPKQIHTIWLGNTLGKEGQQNLVNWKKTNKDYQVNLWIDSSLYSDKTKINEFKELKKWAIKNKITLCDIAQNPGKSVDGVKGCVDIYQSMLSKHFFDDEILGEYKNLAAASDMSRNFISARWNLYRCRRCFSF